MVATPIATSDDAGPMPNATCSPLEMRWSKDGGGKAPVASYGHGEEATDLDGDDDAVAAPRRRFRSPLSRRRAPCVHAVQPRLVASNSSGGEPASSCHVRPLSPRARPTEEQEVEAIVHKITATHIEDQLPADFGGTGQCTASLPVDRHQASPTEEWREHTTWLDADMNMSVIAARHACALEGSSPELAAIIWEGTRALEQWALGNEQGHDETSAEAGGPLASACLSEATNDGVSIQSDETAAEGEEMSDRVVLHDSSCAGINAAPARPKAMTARRAAAQRTIQDAVLIWRSRRVALEQRQRRHEQDPDHLQAAHTTSTAGVVLSEGRSASRELMCDAVFNASSGGAAGGGAAAASSPASSFQQRSSSTGEGSSSLPLTPLTPLSPLPPVAALTLPRATIVAGDSSLSSQTEFVTKLSANELRTAWRLHGDWQRPPSDQPTAVCICDRKDVRIWRWRGAGGIDEYETQFELPIAATSFLAMQTEIGERQRWDVSTKKISNLRVGGSITSLSGVHGQRGDSQALYWLVESPAWPMKDREYVLHRRMVALDRVQHQAAGMATDDGQPAARVLYVRVETCDNLPASWALRAHVASRAVRCVDLNHIQAVWEGVSGSGVACACVRSRYREDPMTALPKWLTGRILDTMLPRSLASLRKVAIEYEKRKLRCSASNARG